MAGRADGDSAHGHQASERAGGRFAGRVTADGRDGRPVATGRHRPVVGRHRPSAGRAVPSRRLPGPEGALPAGGGTPPGPALPGGEVPARGRPRPPVHPFSVPALRRFRP